MSIRRNCSFICGSKINANIWIAVQSHLQWAKWMCLKRNCHTFITLINFTSAIVSVLASNACQQPTTSENIHRTSAFNAPNHFIMQQKKKKYHRDPRIRVASFDIFFSRHLCLSSRLTFLCHGWLPVAWSVVVWLTHWHGWLVCEQR